jgi:hypothetical protein
MSMPLPNPTTPNSRRFLTRLPLPLWIGLAAVVLIVIGLAAAHHRAGLSPSERRLVGRWSFRTCDSSRLLRIFEFRGDRIAVLLDAQQSPVMGPDYYDWRVDDEILVLTRYEERDVNESAMQKVRRTAFAVGEMLQGQPVRGESIEKYKILHRDPNPVELTYSPEGQLDRGCTITLVRAGEARRMN